ncbi:hypothetical protein V2J09_022108 [Rumex salicifolius]
MAGAILPGNISDVRSDIPELRGDNYKVWKERVLLHLGWMDIDYAIRKDEPASITEASTPEAIALYEKWERSNRLSVMFIKTKISASIRGSVDQHEKVKDLIKAIDEQFASSDKALASTLIMQFSSLRHTEIKGVRDYIMRMRDIAAQLKALEVTMSESFLVHFILCTLPQQYAPFKISYNTHKDKWSINELMTMCVQEEGRLSMEEGEKVNLATVSSSKKKKDHIKEKEKGKIPVNQVIKKESKCFFYKKKGHMKKDCINEKFIYSGNKIASHVEAVGTCSLILSSGFNLCLEKTFYVPNFARNLISVSRLVPFGYSFNFSDTGFSIFRKSKVIGSGILSGNLFHLDLQNDTTHNSMHTGLKRCIMNEDSSMLWHRRLGHISIERVKRLVKEGLDPRTISGYFIGYAEKSKGYRFYCPSHSTRIVESRNAKFLENDLISGSDQFHEIIPEIDHHEVPPSDSSDRLVIVHAPQVQSGVGQPNTEIPQIVDQNPTDHVENEVPVHENEQVPLRRSTRERRSAIPDDYEVDFVAMIRISLLSYQWAKWENVGFNK